MFTRCVALAVLFASGCSAPTQFGIESNRVYTPDGIARLDLRISGLVAVSGGTVSSTDASTQLASTGAAREVEVRIHPVPSEEGAWGFDFSSSADDVAAWQRAFDASVRKSEDQQGDCTRITARSATIRSTSESEFVVELDDALLDHARDPIPTVTIKSMHRRE